MECSVITTRSSPALPIATVAIYLNFNRPGRDVYCTSNGKEKRTYETDIASEAPSCLVKDRKTILGYIHAI